MSLKRTIYKSISQIIRNKYGTCISLLFFFGVSGAGFAQVTLDSCLVNALRTHPALKSRTEIEQVFKLQLENNKSSVYPIFSLSGQGKYQSDVIELDLETPFGGLEFPAIPHFQYNAALNANQLIFNGGLKGIEEQEIINDFNAKNAGLDSSERELREKVQKLFLEILLKEKQVEVIQLLRQTIDLSIERLERGIEGGIFPEVELSIIQAERISLNRKYLALDEARKTLIQNLAHLCRMEIDPADEFAAPLVEFAQLQPDRPEYDLFNSRIRGLELRKEKLGVKRAPKISAFGQAGYGRPGLNMLSDKWQDFYIVGLQLAWVPWDYKETRKQKSIIDLNMRMVEYERENFDLYLVNANSRILNHIRFIERIILEDEKMVKAREEISLAMQRKLEEGIITSSEYITQLNKEKEARLELEKSKLELLASKLEYNVLNGK